MSIVEFPFFSILLRGRRSDGDGIEDCKKNQCLDEGEGEEKDEDLSLNVFNSTKVDKALSLISYANEIFNLPHPNYDERYRVLHKEVSTLNFSTLSSDDNQSSDDENKYDFKLKSAQKLDDPDYVPEPHCVILSDSEEEHIEHVKKGKKKHRKSVVGMTKKAIITNKEKDKVDEVRNKESEKGEINETEKEKVVEISEKENEKVDEISEKEKERDETKKRMKMMMK